MFPNVSQCSSNSYQSSRWHKMNQNFKPYLVPMLVFLSTSSDFTRSYAKSAKGKAAARSILDDSALKPFEGKE